MVLLSKTIVVRINYECKFTDDIINYDMTQLYVYPDTEVLLVLVYYVREASYFPIPSMLVLQG